MNRLEKWIDELEDMMDEKDKELQDLRRQIADLKDMATRMETKEKWADDVMRKAIEKWGIEMQSVVAIEELSELQKELTKAIRCLCKIKVSDKVNITEEVADVQIMLWQIQKMYGISIEELGEEINYKLLRLSRRIDGIPE